jgi:hydroxymethylbilane synthase
LRPDLRIVPLRGNVPTRLERIRKGQADATLLAVAGLERLELQEAITEVLDAQRMTPAMAQGALGIETRVGELPAQLAALNDPLSRQAVDAERAFMARIGGGCHTPAGVLAESKATGGWLLTALLATPEGSPLMRRNRPVAIDEDPVATARDLAQTMLAEAPASILETLHTSDPAKRWEE